MARSVAIPSWKNSRRAVVAALCGALVVAAGCVIVPVPTSPVRDIPPEQRGELRLGETARRDILMRYGAPDMRLEGDRILVYHWDRTRAAVILVTLGMAAIPIYDLEALFLEFDERGKLLRTGMALAWRKKTIAEQAQEWARSGSGPPAPR